jgi:hypothetical protein
MKTITFYFGYYGPSKLDRISYWLCKNLPFIPSLEIRLFSTGKVKHSIYLGIFNFYWRWYKINNQWRFENLSNK